MAFRSSSPSATRLIESLLFFLVQNLTINPCNISAQSISESGVFDSADNLADLWSILPSSAQRELAVDVATVLTQVDNDLESLFRTLS